jgi:hypothetical protein
LKHPKAKEKKSSFSSEKTTQWIKDSNNLNPQYKLDSQFDNIDALEGRTEE